MECLGTIVGLDQTLMSQWVADQITAESHTQLFSTLLHPSLPVQSAMAILRLSALPQMSYLLRTLKPTILRLKRLRYSMLKSLKPRLPNFVLSSGARLQLTLPIRHGGFGLRSMVRTLYASYWSGLAQAAPDILASARIAPPCSRIIGLFPLHQYHATPGVVTSYAGSRPMSRLFYFTRAPLCRTFVFSQDIDTRYCHWLLGPLRRCCTCSRRGTSHVPSYCWIVTSFMASGKGVCTSMSTRIFHPYR